MASEIAQYLQATLSSDPNVRISAELRLSELSAHSGKGLLVFQGERTWLNDIRTRY